MQKTYLYKQIVESIRREILEGHLKPGDRLPPIRKMKEQWDCTPGTVQHAYKELANQQLVVSQPGKGTTVIASPKTAGDPSLRIASLVHRAEAFLLESMTAGYSPPEIEKAISMALDRWKVIEESPPVLPANTIIFAGSHDMVINWISARLQDTLPDYRIELRFVGSLGGLFSLASGNADIAGCHLWDVETDSYNIPFIRKLLPGKDLQVVTLAHRRLGLITPAGNPFGIKKLDDLTQTGTQFINRQDGSGTRVWLDASLQKLGIDTSSVNGYGNEVFTHSDVARSIAEGKANVGLGLEAAALSYGLDFVFLTKERYDLVIPASLAHRKEYKTLINIIQDPKTREAIDNFGGYESSQTGNLILLD